MSNKLKNFCIKIEDCTEVYSKDFVKASNAKEARYIWRNFHGGNAKEKEVKNMNKRAHSGSYNRYIRLEELESRPKEDKIKRYDRSVLYFVLIADEMRESQRKFLQTRDESILIRLKQLEEKFDDLVQQFIDFGYWSVPLATVAKCSCGKDVNEGFDPLKEYEDKIRNAFIALGATDDEDLRESIIEQLEI